MKDLKDILNEEISKTEVYKLLLGEKPLTSGNKVAQEKRLRSKCNYHTVGKGRGTKYVVTEIFESDRHIQDGRVNNKGGNNSKTVHLLENIIIYTLVDQQLENGKELEYTELLLSKNNALVTMNMVNAEYMKRYYKDYEGLENIINDYLVERYFMLNHSKIQQRLQSALNSLRRKSLINYSEVIQVKIVEGGEYEYRKATKNELLAILEIENKIMHQMLGNQYSEIKVHKGLIYAKNLYEKFYSNCIKELYNQGYDYIQSYCNAYEISTTSNLLLSNIEVDNLEDDVKRVKEDLKRMCNNNMIKDLEKIRKKLEDSANNIIFGYKSKPDTNHIDEYIKSIKMFTERIF